MISTLYTQWQKMTWWTYKFFSAKIHKDIFEVGIHNIVLIVILCSGAPDDSTGDNKISPGDFVRVELDVEVLRIMQEDHGGWNEDMKSVSCHPQH